MCPETLADGTDVELGRVASGGRGLILARQRSGLVAVAIVALKDGAVSKVFCVFRVTRAELNELADMIDLVATDLEDEQAKAS